MQTSFKANLLKHLVAKKEEGGFTLIELLVVIIIIGILAAIALPSFLNQANKARQSEAQTYTGSVNRAQQAYYLEAARFSDNLANLGLGIKQDTDNYSYRVSGGAAGAKFVDVFAKPAIAGAYNKDAALLGFIGTTAIGSTTGVVGGEATTVAILCKSTTTPVQGLAEASFAANTTADGTKTPTCMPGFVATK